MGQNNPALLGSNLRLRGIHKNSPVRNSSDTCNLADFRAHFVVDWSHIYI